MRSRKVRLWLDLVNPRLLGTWAIINILMIFANGCSFFRVCFPLVLMIFSHRLLEAVKAFTWEMRMLCYFCGISSSSRAVSSLKSIPCNTRWFVPFPVHRKRPEAKFPSSSACFLLRRPITRQTLWATFQQQRQSIRLYKVALPYFFPRFLV